MIILNLGQGLDLDKESEGGPPNWLLWQVFFFSCELRDVEENQCLAIVNLGCVPR